MSILIKGMEMPETCDMCPMLVSIEKGDDHDAFCYCKLSNWKKSCTPDPMTIFEARRFRHLNCPLIELPPHGDLIDRDALIKDGWLNLHKEVIRMGGYAIHELPLKNPSIPVIIPAESEGE